MSILSRIRRRRPVIPDGLWMKCQSCEEIIYTKTLYEGNKLCPKCGYHYPLSARERIALLCDEGSFVERDAYLIPLDPLQFPEYLDKQEKSRSKTKEYEAVVTGVGRIEGIATAIGVMDFGYIGGTMGSVVGEKVTRLIEHACTERLPLLVVSASGGVRMQESIIGLMQMAKTSAALYRLRQARVPYISLLTNPTTGGTTASYASLGDVNIAEPKALICFAGPRVIKQTIRQELPEGFQTAEFLLEHGLLDMVVPRPELKATIARLLRYLLNLPVAGPEAAA
ncbi:MAG: acetyl-CoA carboxylase, carboxyltransferase subunit beta [bacterium]|nr:acetyl-CoA carboxylase, carboxyltransferase subunit beta [bacterium]